MKKSSYKTTDSKPAVKLGTDVFVLSSDGAVVRTMVAEISDSGYYTFLNGMGSHCRHWFSYREAVDAAQAQITSAETRLLEQVSALRRKRKFLITEEAEERVMTSAYKVVNLDREESLRTRRLKKVVVPDKYPTPGTKVYLAILPHTEVSGDVYRPYERFILETVVRLVSFSPDGKLRIVFVAPFRVDDYYLSRSEAKKAHPTIDEFVSHEEEVRRRRSIEDDVPF